MIHHMLVPYPSSAQHNSRHGLSWTVPTGGRLSALAYATVSLFDVDRHWSIGPWQERVYLCHVLPGRHTRKMRRIALVDMKIPEENLSFYKDAGAIKLFFQTEEERSAGRRTLVIGVPSTRMTKLTSQDPGVISRFNVLFVGAAGNRNSFGGRRDLWNPDHPHWKEYPRAYESAFRAFDTGKVILARYARRTSSGKIVPDDYGSVYCGTAMEVCYSVLWNGVSAWDGTSGASIRLGALAFYLSQLWDTAEEVVGVLNVCAEDVGDPGVDEIYGRGIVSVICDTVRNREVSTVAQTTEIHSFSPILGQMTEEVYHEPQSPAFSVNAEYFTPFFALNGHNLRTMTGHMGGRLSLRGIDLFFAGGTGYTPLGVRSSLAYDGRVPFMEFGTKRNLLENNGHILSLLGTYGYNGGSNISARVGHIGVRYEMLLTESSRFSFLTGYRRAWGKIGILGYREAGAERITFTDDTPEIRLSFSLNK